MQSIGEKIVAVATIVVLLAGPAPAQDTAPADETDAAPAAAPETDGAAEPAAGDEAAPAEGGDAAPAENAGDAPADGAGDPAAPEVLEVVRETFDDWEVRCAPEGDECFIYQLALDTENNPVAEVSLIRLPPGGEAAAGVTVVTPLGTLLPAGLVMQIDSGEQRQYPYSWCSQVGCFARFGFSGPTVTAMKRGRGATLRLASIAAPDQPVSLDISLNGFTAAFDSLEPSETVE